MIFEKGNYAKIHGAWYECVLCDEELAALAPVKKTKEGWISSKISSAQFYSNYKSSEEFIDGLEELLPNGDDINTSELELELFGMGEEQAINEGGKMDFAKCHKCGFCEPIDCGAAGETGVMLLCKITGESMTLTKCPFCFWFLDS